MSASFTELFWTCDECGAQKSCGESLFHVFEKSVCRDCQEAIGKRLVVDTVGKELKHMEWFA